MIKFKSLAYLNLAFNQVISHFSLYNHKIEQVQCDSESNLGACTEFLNSKGIQIQQVPPYQHAQRIERYVRTLNDRMRSVLDSLSFYLPAKLYGELLLSTILKMNQLPNSTHKTITPLMLFGGTKLDTQETHLLPFGTICMFHEPGNENLGKLEARYIHGTTAT
jgi:hypothetical protein